MSKLRKRRSISVREDVYLAVKAKMEDQNMSASSIVTKLIEAHLEPKYLGMGKDRAQNLYEKRLRESQSQSLTSHKDIVIDHPIDHTKPPAPPPILAMDKEEIKKKREGLAFPPAEKKMVPKKDLGEDDFYGGVKSF